VVVVSLQVLKNKPIRREWRSARVSSQGTRKFGYLVCGCGELLDTRGCRIAGYTLPLSFSHKQCKTGKVFLMSKARSFLHQSKPKPPTRHIEWMYSRGGKYPSQVKINTELVKGDLGPMSANFKYGSLLNTTTRVLFLCHTSQTMRRTHIRERTTTNPVLQNEDRLL
jgi:hypothetical protein